MGFTFAPVSKGGAVRDGWAVEYSATDLFGVDLPKPPTAVALSWVISLAISKSLRPLCKYGLFAFCALAIRARLPPAAPKASLTAATAYPAAIFASSKAAPVTVLTSFVRILPSAGSLKL